VKIFYFKFIRYYRKALNGGSDLEFQSFNVVNQQKSSNCTYSVFIMIQWRTECFKVILRKFA